MPAIDRVSTDMTTDASRRVVVTGTGVVSPIGVTTDEFWDSLLSGHTNFTESSVDGVPFVATVPDGWEENLKPRTRRYSDRCTRLSLRAAREALHQSGILDDEAVTHTGMYIGTSVGGVGTLSEEFSAGAVHGLTRISPLIVPKALINMIGANIAIEFGLTGETLSYGSACASGTVAIGEAFRRVRSGDVDIALAGGVDTCVTDQVVEPFRKLGAMSNSTDPETASIPFSKNRSGFVMSEGAGMVVLETMDRATARGATVLAEIVGYHGSSDGHSLLSPNVDGIRRAMTGLFRPGSGFNASDVGYVNAHGTSTPLNDAAESQAISEVFEHRPLVSSTKSYYGHPLGAAGAFEAIICALGLYHEVAIPTVNVGADEIDPEIDLNLLLEAPTAMPDGLVVSNSFAFGGHNATLLLSR